MRYLERQTGIHTIDLFASHLQVLLSGLGRRSDNSVLLVSASGITSLKSETLNCRPPPQFDESDRSFGVFALGCWQVVYNKVYEHDILANRPAQRTTVLPIPMDAPLFRYAKKQFRLAWLKSGRKSNGRGIGRVGWKHRKSNSC